MSIRLGSTNATNNQVYLPCPFALDTGIGVRLTNTGTDTLIINNIRGTGQSQEYLLAGTQMVYKISNDQTRPYVTGLTTAPSAVAAALLVEWTDDADNDFPGTYPFGLGAEGGGDNLINVLDNPYANLSGDGVTNDQPALQKLVNAVGAAGGGTLEIPPDTVLLIQDHGVLWQPNVGIQGHGASSVIKYTNPNTGLAVSLIWTVFQSQASFANPLKGQIFRDFAIDGSSIMGGYSVGMKGLNFQFVVDCLFSNILITGTAATGFGVDFLSNCHVEHIVSIGCGRLNGGVNPGGGGLGIGTGGQRDLNDTVADATFINGQNTLSSATANFPTGNWSETVGQQPIVGALVTSANVPAGTIVTAIVSATQLLMSATATASGTASSTLTYTNSLEYLATSFINCVSLGSGYKGIFFESQSTVSAFPRSKGIKVVGGSYTGGILGCADWGCDGLVVEGVDLSGNSLDGFNVSPLGVVGVIGINGLVVNSQIRNNTRDGVRFQDVNYTNASGYQVLNNRIYNNGGHGVNASLNTTTNAAQYLDISDNRIGFNGGCGIHADATIDDGFIHNNQIYDNGQNATLTQLQRSGIGLESTSTPTRLSVVGNKMYDDQGVKTQQNGWYWGAAGNPNNLNLYDNDGNGNANTAFGIGSTGCFAFPNVTPGPSGSVGGNVGSIFVGNGGLNNGQATVTVSAGNTPASGAVYRVGAQQEQLWFSCTGTITALRIGGSAVIPVPVAGLTFYGPILGSANDGVIPTYTGVLTIVARPQ